MYFADWSDQNNLDISDMSSCESKHQIQHQNIYVVDLYVHFKEAASKPLTQKKSGIAAAHERFSLPFVCSVLLWSHPFWTDPKFLKDSVPRRYKAGPHSVAQQ